MVLFPNMPSLAERYFGAEAGKGWVLQVKSMFTQMARIAVDSRMGGYPRFRAALPQRDSSRYGRPGLICQRFTTSRQLSREEFTPYKIHHTYKTCALLCEHPLI